MNNPLFINEVRFLHPHVTFWLKTPMLKKHIMSGYSIKTFPCFVEKSQKSGKITNYIEPGNFLYAKVVFKHFIKYFLA